MEELDVEGEFDVHEHREGLKLLRQDRETMALANRAPFACPACGEAFEQLFVSEKRANSFGSPDTPICIVRTDRQVLVLSH